MFIISPPGVHPGIRMQPRPDEFFVIANDF
jgi:hypothetical protein